MWQLFSINSPYKKRAKYAAILWTLLIFVLCLIPGNELPDVDIPLIDKWAHIVLFGIFAFLWLCATPSNNTYYLVIILCITIFMGWVVEYIQGHYVQGRSQDNMDTVADSIGGLVGILLFVLFFSIAKKKANG